MNTRITAHKFFVLFVMLGMLLLAVSVSADSGVKYYQPITEIDLGVKELTLRVGSQYFLPLTHQPEETPVSFLKWYMDESVIRVDPESFAVTALAPGKTRLLVESNLGFTYDYCDITVVGSQSKNVVEKKSGGEFVTLSREDRNKIKAETVLRYLDFIENNNFNSQKFEAAAGRDFNVTAIVSAGKAAAESKRAASLGMEKALALPDLNAVSLHGTFSQILAFVKNNDDLIRIIEFAPVSIDEPAVNDGGPAQKAMNLQDNVEALTTVSKAHNLGLKGDGTVIAVIDMGLNKDHVQFKGRVIAEYCAGMSSGYAHPVCSTGSSAPSNSQAPALHNHGSHVAGIAAGSAGIAPNAKIVSINNAVEDLDDKGDYVAYMYCDPLAISQYLVDLQKSYKKAGKPLIIAANMSYALDYVEPITGVCDSMYPEIKESIDLLIDNDIIPVVGAGNFGYVEQLNTPACLSGSLVVGALWAQADPVIAYYSNHGSRVIILAPGSDIWSAFYAYDSDPICESVCDDGVGGTKNCYGIMDGTSMAAPMVSGALAILKQLYPEKSAADLVDVLLDISTKSAGQRNSGQVQLPTGVITAVPARTFGYNIPVLDFSRIDRTNSVDILDASGNVVTGKELIVSTKTYQLGAAASPSVAQQQFVWTCSNESAVVTPSGKVTFSQPGIVTITAKAKDGSNVSAKVTITYDPVVSFVRRAYQLILLREPDSGGLTYYVDRLKAGSLTGAQMTMNFINSPEFQGKKYSNEKVVEILYLTMMDRAADANGRKYWAQFLNDGLSQKYVVRGFAGSAEFKNICSNYGITPGTLALTENRDKNPKVTAFVSRNYSIALGRKGDVSGLNYWTGMILTKKLTPQQVADSFVFSKECVSKNLNNTEFVKMLYRLYMGREYDQGGLNYWLQQMDKGMTRQTVAKSFGGSKEFRNIVASYGL